MKENDITLVKLASVICITLILLVVIIMAIINTGVFTNIKNISKQDKNISETEEISKVATVYPVSVGD